MKSKWGVVALIILSLASGDVEAASCSGRGTVVFFGNGMFNSLPDALNSRNRLEQLLRKDGISAYGDTQLLVDVAYKRSEPLLVQLLNVAVQKGVTDFENFWAWLASLQKSPDWFNENIQALNLELLRTNVIQFDDVQDHFEKYEEYIGKGYNVILVSHSQGNLYANQAMAKLARYTDGSLTGSLAEKEASNPLFPKFSDLFANVQVATPVSATVDASPWTTFKNDLIIEVVRKSVGALPGNIGESGQGHAPDGDPLGHNFIKSYLRVDESRVKILTDIKNASARLKYPIAYFQRAMLITQSAPLHQKGIQDLTFNIHSQNGKDLGGYDEELLASKSLLQKNFSYCFELESGDARITAETVLSGMKSYEFKYTVWPEGGMDQAREKPIQIQFQAGSGIKRWDIGVIHTKAGLGKEPLDVQVEIYPKPRPR